MIGASLHVRSSRHDVGAAPSGQHEIEHDGVGRPSGRRGERVCAVSARLDLVARAAQARRERAQELRLVVDDEDRVLSDDRRQVERQRAARCRRPRRAARAARRSTAAKPRAIARPRPSARALERSPPRARRAPRSTTERRVDARVDGRRTSRART